MGKRLAPALIIAAGCMWGTVGLFVRYLSDAGLDAMSIVEARLFGAFIITFIGLLIYDRRLLRVKRKDLWCFVGSGVASGIFLNFFYSTAIEMVSLALAATLLSTAPVFVIILSALLFRERITPAKLRSLALAFCGCALASGLFDGIGAFSLPGLAVGLASGLGYALYSVFSRLAINRGYSSLTINIYSFLFASVGCCFFADFGRIGGLLAASPLPFGSFLLLHAVIASVAPYMLYTFGMKYVDTGRASILVSCEPVAATLFGVIAYREIPSLLTAAGVALVLLALVLLNLPPRPPAGKQAPSIGNRPPDAALPPDR
ncbi:MAG: DMT family transporter [Clostridiales Family XIII bacterium]|nr:DMT family transporter [Clostridiales Family XIII bacterium]